MAFSSLGTSLTATQSRTLGSFALDPRASCMHLPVTCARSSASAVQTRKKCLSSTATRAGARPLAWWGANCWLRSAFQPSFVRSMGACWLILSWPTAYARAPLLRRPKLEIPPFGPNTYSQRAGPACYRGAGQNSLIAATEEHRSLCCRWELYMSVAASGLHGRILSHILPAREQLKLLVLLPRFGYDWNTRPTAGGWTNTPEAGCLKQYENQLHSKVGPEGLRRLCQLPSRQGRAPVRVPRQSPHPQAAGSPRQPRRCPPPLA